MLKIELIPTLSQCIETVARRQHAELVQQLLASGIENKELEEKLEILNLFLKRMDFRKLRSESEKRLIEGKNVRFMVYLKKGHLKYEMRVT